MSWGAGTWEWRTDDEANDTWKWSTSDEANWTAANTWEWRTNDGWSWGADSWKWRTNDEEDSTDDDENFLGEVVEPIIQKLTEI